MRLPWWKARGVILFIAIVSAAIIVAHALSYVLSNERSRQMLDEYYRLTRSHWSFANRKFLPIGLGTAIGSGIAFWWSGRDPTGGLIAGGSLMVVGIVAHIVWVKRRTS
jgi:hypothetical protein